MACRFCYTYEFVKNSWKKRKEHFVPSVKQHIKACLVEYLTANRRRKGMHLINTRPLNFCPECGRKLNKKKIVREEESNE